MGKYKTIAIGVMGMLMVSACSDDLFEDHNKLPDDAMAIVPYAWGLTPQTRVDYYDNTNWGNEEGTQEKSIQGDDDLKEADLGTTLDVFIAGADADNASFWKQYHLKQSDGANVKDRVADLLASGQWMQDEGIVAGKKYDVWVAVNNAETNATIANKTDLMGLSHTNTDVDKIYAADGLQDGPEYMPAAKSADRRLLMAGHTLWTPTTERQQKIEVPLTRLASKVVVSVTFDPAFIATKKAEGVEITAPAWKYANWNQKTRIFPEATQFTADELELKTNSGRACATRDSWNDASLIVRSTDYYYHTEGSQTTYYSANYVKQEGGKYYYVDPTDESQRVEVRKATDDMAVDVPTCDIITYTYAFDWTGKSAMDYAPNILLSFGYRKDGHTSYNYYRIPVVDEAVTSKIMSNHIYKVNAVVAGEGSTNVTEDFKDLILNYEVVEWTERENQRSMVKGDRLYFFLLEPTLYNIYGTQTDALTISYSAHHDAVVRLSDIEVYYYNNNGKVEIATIPGGNTTTSGQLTGNTKGYNYSITLDEANHTISVTSDVLKNHAVKFIKFRVYASDRADWYSQGYYADVTVKHFPIDNIQSIEGLWSSRWGGTQTDREYSWDPVADGWASSYDGISSEDNIECTLEEYNKAVHGKTTNTSSDPVGTPSDYNSRSNIETGGNNSNMQTYFRNAVPENYRSGANSEANAYKDPNSNYWYWGTGQTDGSWRNYDWYDDGWWDNTYYRYSTYNRRIYYKNVTHYYARRYYRDVQTPTTGNWTDYENGGGSTWRDNNNNGGYGYRAKWFDESTGICRELQGNGYASQEGANVATTDGKNNNHMYVIQITATSSNYVLGRPTINNNYQSQDHVVSPAFMIASQLGAVRSASFNATRAARHCGTYMEVGKDGTRYVGWRLPTAEEVKVIIQYQKDPNVTADGTMAVVLGGARYYTLDGNSQATDVETGDDTYVRCIRDLTADEVKALNGKAN